MSRQYVKTARLEASLCGLAIHTEPGIRYTRIRTTWDIHDAKTGKFFGHFKNGPALLRAVRMLAQTEYHRQAAEVPHA